METQELAVNCGKVSNGIFEGWAKSLSPEGQIEELKARQTLLNAVGAWQGIGKQERLSAAVVGERLDGYAALYKKYKLNKSSEIKLAVIMAGIPGVSKAKAYRCLSIYRVGQMPGVLDAALSLGIDLSNQGQGKLVNRIRRERRPGSPRESLSASEIVSYCIEQIAKELEAGKAPTILKSAQPIPKKPTMACAGDYDAEIAALKAEFKAAYADDTEAETIINQIIIAALKAQIGKLPVRRAA